MPEFKNGFLAAKGFEDQLIQELDGIVARHDRLILTNHRPEKNPFWAQNIWFNPTVIPIQSIKDAAGQLKALQRNWCLYSFDLHRRAQLIQEELPHVSAKPLQFPSPLPKSSLGSWTLLDRNTLLAATECSSLFPNGEMNFEEDKKKPPNRAYLKLWEALTHVQEYPRSGQFCIDAGASPGGWTWVLQQLGAKVWSIDRSSLEPGILKLPGVHFEKRDAFSLQPGDLPRTLKKADWLLSDVVCYPEKLFDWVMMWVESGACDNFICTIKFQGEGDYPMAQKFNEIPDSTVLHLHYNKHELTWIKLKSWEQSRLQR
ncbi:MAG: methyltransferase [Nitrospinaceae bacterium]|nr:MAG: methyltransferase [Nitrospinaceae bacterium]